MSSSFTTAASLEWVFCIHEASHHVIYSRIAPNLPPDPTVPANITRSIASGAIKLPDTEGDITQSTIYHEFVVIRVGRQEYVAVILKKNPDRFTREALHAFGIKSGSRWARELATLSTDLEGDTSVFERRTAWGGTADDLVEDCFHLSLLKDI